MPGAFPRGTQHFPDASHASDQDVSRAYAALDPMIARYDEATESLYANEAAWLLPAEQDLSFHLLFAAVGVGSIFCYRMRKPPSM
jgi:hypothetical protein